MIEGQKTRRRFLADLLFVGGGLTAAGLLAKSRLSTFEPAPSPAGNMVAPPPPSPEPQPTTPGKMAIPHPAPDGEVALPLATPSCEEPANIEPEQMPHPAGAPMPARRTP